MNKRYWSDMTELGNTNNLVVDDDVLYKFNRYYIVQLSGRYNMITEADKAAAEAGLSMEDYKFIINNYSRLYDEWKEHVNKKLG